MIRRIIRIDEALCNGCGACAGACHEGAIQMVDGKAKLTKEHYCDGLGDCLPACPAGAISFETREAPAYDAAAVEASKQRPAGGCPGSAARPLSGGAETAAPPRTGGQLSQWPVQLKLVPTRAPFFDGAELLVAADCCAYAYGSFHSDFIRGRVTLIGCPKLDAVDYAEKLGRILSENDIRGVTLTRMEVPCCGGLEYALGRALDACGKAIPCRVVTISAQGEILE